MAASIGRQSNLTCFRNKETIAFEKRSSEGGNWKKDLDTRVAEYFKSVYLWVIDPFHKFQWTRDTDNESEFSKMSRKFFERQTTSIWTRNSIFKETKSPKNGSKIENASEDSELSRTFIPRRLNFSTCCVTKRHRIEMIFFSKKKKKKFSSSLEN